MLTLVALGAIVSFIAGAALSAALVYWRLRHNRKLKAQQTTFDFIVDGQRDPQFRERREKFMAVVGDESKESGVADSDSTDSLMVAAYLNHFEIAAIGVLRGIMDRQMYADYAQGTVVRAWTKAERYINLRRAAKGEPKLYENLEKLAKDWA